MRKIGAWIGSSVLIVGVACFLQVPRQFAGEKDVKKFSKKSEANLEAKRALIQQELQTLKAHPWAGEYYYGDGLGVNVDLSLAPKSGFAFTWNGCLGLYDLNYGDVVETDGRIRLVLRLPNESEGFRGIAPEFIPVVWGERHYLISPEEVVKFANAINAGFEPRGGAGGRFLLRRDDVSKSVSGFPNLPPQYSEYLLKQPIEAEISSVKESRIEGSERITTAVLNVGTAQGVRQGMEFWVYEPSAIYGLAQITSVGSSYSEATIDQYEADKPRLPSPGWKLSTHVGCDQECGQTKEK